MFPQVNPHKCVWMERWPRCGKVARPVGGRSVPTRRPPLGTTSSTPSGLSSTVIHRVVHSRGRRGPSTDCARRIVSTALRGKALVTPRFARDPQFVWSTSAPVIARMPQPTDCLWMTVDNSTHTLCTKGLSAVATASVDVPEGCIHSSVHPGGNPCGSVWTTLGGGWRRHETSSGQRCGCPRAHGGRRRWIERWPGGERGPRGASPRSPAQEGEPVGGEPGEFRARERAATSAGRPGRTSDVRTDCPAVGPWASCVSPGAAA